jgi:hypothetical protein
MERCKERLVQQSARHLPRPAGQMGGHFPVGSSSLWSFSARRQDRVANAACLEVHRAAGGRCTTGERPSSSQPVGLMNLRTDRGGNLLPLTIALV